MKKININCPVGSTGYGITSLNIIKNLDQIQNLEISLFPLNNNIELNSKDEQQIIKKMLSNADNSYDYKSPCLKIWHQFDLANRIGSGSYFSFPFFEVDELRPKEKIHLNSCDAIFVASHWAKKILINNNITKPIFVAPLAADLSIFKYEPKINLPQDKYIFFHIGKWEYRKSQDFLFKCFDNAFTEKDNVELWLLPFNQFLTKEEESKWTNLAKSSKLASKIKIFDRLPSQYHVANFIGNAHCGVFLSRAEGWNNEIIESMAMNKPIITTNYSAHTEYCTTNNSYLVDIDQEEIANDGKWFHGIGKWAKLESDQLEQTTSYMKHVYNNNITTNPDGLETCKKYTWTNTAKTIYDNIFN